MKLLDGQVLFHQDRVTNDLIIEKRQEIPEEFLSMLQGVKDDSTDQREGEFMLCASVPTDVHELWLARDNYDMLKEDIRTTLKKLRAEGLDKFITTNKRV